MKERQLNDNILKSLIDTHYLILPVLCAILLLLLWGTHDFFWAAPLFGGIGWFLMFFSVYVIVPSSKKFIAIEIFYAAMMAVVILCSVLIPLKYIIPHLLELHVPVEPATISAQDNLLQGSFNQEDLKELHSRIEVLEQLLEVIEIKERGYP